ncbi:MAG: class I SAM-dependent methyltransferase [Epsilonproteobacteria bacterium]|nr:class I SAM-dependent methyltransferase [Campylobacterota bacterium]
MNKWDEKAKNYTRYSPSLNTFEANVVKTLEKMGVDFKNKSVIDVGCGTGIYTIKIAKIAKSVVGIDFSINMLEALNEDCKKLNINNIKTRHSTWDDFKLNNQKFDIAICTMSPAVKTDGNIKKFHECAKIKIYLGWAGVRDCTILDELFLAHDAVYSAPNGAKRVKNWLETNKLKYKIENFEELKIKKRTYKEAIENFSWHLNVRGINPKINKVEKILKPLCDNAQNITEQTINKMDLFIWK